MMNIRTRLSVVLLSLLVACGDSPTDGAREIVVTLQTSLLTTLGEDAQLRVSRAGKELTNFELSLATDQRWVDDAPVLSAHDLALRRVVASAPGRARVEVRIAHELVGTIDVSVQPAAPLLISALDELSTGNETVRLRGYRMTDLAATAIAIAGVATTYEAIDSANGRLTVPSLPPAAEPCGSMQSVVVNGVSLAPGFALKRAPSRMRGLQPGQTVRLSALAAACFQLDSSAAHTRYAIAYLEPTTVVDSGMWRAATFSPPRLPVDLKLTAVSAATTMSFARATGVRAAHAAHVANSAFGRHVQAEQRHAYLDRTRFTVGDRFEVIPSETFRQFVPQAGVMTGTVLAVLGGYVPVIIPANTDAARVDVLRQAFTEVGARLIDDVMPYTAALYDGQRPLTAAGYFPIVVHVEEIRNGQAAVMIMRDDHVELALYGAEFRLPFMLRNLTRAISYAHLMQSVGGYRDDLLQTGLQEWGASAVLALLTNEALRRARGLGFLDNWDIEAESPLTPFNFDLRLELAADGVLWGSAGSAFLRDQVGRLMTEAGMSHMDAMRTVVRAAAYGFFGCSQDQCSGRPALSAVMRGILGERWNPVDELLLSVLAQAADDLTNNPRLQNRSYLQAGSRPFGSSTFTTSGTIWQNARLLTAGSGAVEALRVPQGSYGYALLDDGGKGATYSMTSSLPLEWMLVRIH